MTQHGYTPPCGRRWDCYIEWLYKDQKSTTVKPDMERHKQVASMIHRNICGEYGLKAQGSRWQTPPKVIESKWVKILWDFQIQTDKLVMADQSDIMMVAEHQRTAVVDETATSGRRNMKSSRYQGVKEELVPTVIKTLGAVGTGNPKLDWWPQQMPGKTSEIITGNS